MSSSKNTHERDAESGRYVSDEYAKEHPSTTVSESAKKPEIWHLLKMLSTDGGAIVRSSDVSAEDDLEQAKTDGRYWGDFVYVPIEE